MIKTNIKWSIDEINILKQNYEKESIKNIKRCFKNRSEMAIMIKANKLGLKKQIKDREHTRKHFCNFDYFKNIDTCNKAYYLGWAFSDGNICGNQYRLRLIKSDKEVLLNMNKDIESDYKIYERHNYCELAITNSLFCENLIDKGCIKRKSYKIVFPNININYWLDFIKGVYDGDGSYICTNKTKKIDLVSGSITFIIQIHNILKFYRIKSYVYKSKNCNYARLQISSKKIYINLQKWF